MAFDCKERSTRWWRASSYSILPLLVRYSWYCNRSQSLRILEGVQCESLLHRQLPNCHETDKIRLASLHTVRAWPSFNPKKDVEFVCNLLFPVIGFDIHGGRRPWSISSQLEYLYYVQGHSWVVKRATNLFATACRYSSLQPVQHICYAC